MDTIKVWICRIAVGLIFFSLSIEGIASTAIPSSADVNRIPDRYHETASQLPPVSKTAAVSPTPPGTKTHLQAAQVKFVLSAIIIDGATVYRQRDLAYLYADKIGKTVSVADIQTLAEAVTARYRQDGYVLSQAILPPQRIQHGVVHIRVIEGYIDKVSIQGVTDKQATILKHYAQHIVASKPLNMKVLERYALLANDLPGMEVKTLLMPSQHKPAASDLTLIAKLHRLNGSISYDNRGTRFLGPQEYLISADINGLFRHGDLTGFHGTVTNKPQELKYLEIHHNRVISERGMQFNLSVSHTETHPGSTLKPFDVRGISNDVIAMLVYPKIRSRERNLYWHTGFDWLDSNTHILGLQLYNDHIRSLRLGLDYNSIDTHQGINGLGAEISQGLPLFGASGSNPAYLSRPKGHSQYTKFTANASRLQGLPHQFSLLLATQGQYSLQPLLAAEQFGYGGNQFGRAFDPSALTGDSGIEGKAELRFDARANRFLTSAQYYAFYDMGLLWNRDNVNQIGRTSAVSAGLGTRLSITPHIKANLEVARPMTQKADIPNTNGKAPRVFFGIMLQEESNPTNMSETPGLNAAMQESQAATQRLAH